MLARNFGTVINADAFEALASVLDFKIIRKLGLQKDQLEIVLLGLAGLLSETAEEQEPGSWKEECEYNKHKYQLVTGINQKVQFYKLRPPNFPTIRLSQLAQFYEQRTDLFSLVIAAKTRAQVQELFKIETSFYWETQYYFGKIHKSDLNKYSGIYKYLNN
ncbi:putative protein DUF2851 [Leeuwenhoekiella polynyae]|uniref:Uncharacterized protein n=2 Tax=Leeuwenhoekiella polynyae TaxID=1550906 RepID=A0A4V1KRJ2_9FLAO|nr:putative protein DUF2851 [Leeuwenhoekiella polynyae]